MHHVGLLADAHNDVARFEITVNEVARMDILQATELDIADISPSVKASEIKYINQLPSQEQNSSSRKIKMVVNKEVLKGWA